MGLGVWATIPALAQGVPIFDPALAAENARQMAERLQDQALQIGKGEQRARIEEIKRQQLAQLDEFIESATILANPPILAEPRKDVGATIQSLEAGEDAETSAAAVYPESETSLPARQLFGDARQTIEEIIIQARATPTIIPALPALAYHQCNGARCCKP